MTSSPSPVVCPPSAAAPVVDGAAAAPRKRRRRAPATGAADDCFACRKRHVKCDRRRPYCSQCLEHGKECSGYKTQLTWGVGVASRGKLRGLSLPIAKSKPAVGSTAARAAAPRPAPLKTPVKAAALSQQIHLVTPVHRAKPVPTMANIMTYDFVNMDPTGSPTIPDAHSPGLHSPRFDYSTPPSYERHDTLTSSVRSMRANPAYLDPSSPWRLDTPMSSPMNSEFGLSTPASSISGFSEGDMGSPMDFPATPDDASFMATSPYPSYYGAQPAQQQPQSVSMWPSGSRHSYHRRAPTSYPDAYPSAPSMCSSLSSNPSHYEPVEDNNAAAGHVNGNGNGNSVGAGAGYASEPIGQCNLSEILYDDGVSGGAAPSPTDIELGFGWVSHVHRTLALD
ncbi:MAG: hypothetical protein M1832_003641 [Thelocarpon impressellum]|nr:MAG: hypothetical protein M1832_003641 [Thelocarpon impressellum]